jgi:hypothetical protein
MKKQGRTSAALQFVGLAQSLAQLTAAHLIDHLQPAQVLLILCGIKVGDASFDSRAVV